MVQTKVQTNTRVINLLLRMPRTPTKALAHIVFVMEDKMFTYTELSKTNVALLWTNTNEHTHHLSDATLLTSVFRC